MASRGSTVESRESLRVLCDHYYEPVFAYLKRTGRDRDVAHDFFAYLLEGNRFEHLEREKGRFRSYLLGSLKHFLSHRFARSQAAKRGGNAESYSLNETGAGEVAGGSLPPDAWFDQQWALALLRLALLRRALARVELECRDEGNETQFQHLSPWLTGESEYGDQAELAEKVGVPVNTLKSTIHRLRRRSRKAVKAEISEMLLDSADVENEMTALFAALKNK